MSSAGAGVLVTGTSTGIGRASAGALARAGFEVFAAVRREESLAELGSLGEGVHPILLDVACDESIGAAVSRVRDILGGRRLRAVVNNAGISRQGPLELIDRSEFEEVLRVNLSAPLWVTRAFLPLVASPGGRIVNVGSGEGFIVLPINGAYAVAKRGLEALSDVLRLELAAGGRFVSVVVPGGVATPIQQRGLERYAELLERGGSMQPYHRMIRGRARIASRGLQGRGPEGVASAVVRAVASERPRPHYFVGWDARLPALLARLPVTIRDAFLRRAVA